MKVLSRLKAISDEDKAHAVRKIIEDATPDFDFFYFTILSVLMAAFGLLAESETVVIGSMLLAPIMSPVVATALALSMSNQPLMIRSLRTLGRATAIAIVASAVATILFSYGSMGASNIADNVIIMSRTSPSLLYFAVAIVAGLAVAYTSAQPHLSSNLTGAAVAVALMPPLAVVGIGIASIDVQMAAQALVMYIVNVAGIIFAAMLSFSLMDVHDKNREANTKIVEEQLRVQEEEQKVAEIADQDDDITGAEERKSG